MRTMLVAHIETCLSMQHGNLSLVRKSAQILLSFFNYKVPEHARWMLQTDIHIVAVTSNDNRISMDQGFAICNTLKVTKYNRSGCSYVLKVVLKSCLQDVYSCLKSCGCCRFTCNLIIMYQVNFPIDTFIQY